MSRVVISPPTFLDVVLQQWAAILEAHEKLAPQDCYLHWEELKQRAKPEGISHEVWWAALKLARTAKLRPIALFDREKRPFKFNIPDGLIEILHRLDHGGSETEIRPEEFDRFYASALLEESMASARLAGATTNYAVAKEMLRNGQRPRERSEQMILNQHLALQRVWNWQDRELSPERIFELHRCITAGTLDKPETAGRFRQDGENSPIIDAAGGVQYEPPPAGELPRRMELMCAFANGQAPDFFLHPIIRAIVLHFWLAYDRPFCDGNGRIARTLFRWAVLRQNYPRLGCISISDVLLRAPARYARVFLHTETDDNDLTYFILHQAEVIRAAERALHDRVVRKTNELQEAKKKLRGLAELNPRQQAVIEHALRKPDTRYLIAGHQRSHGVTHQTARDDLFDLTQRELLVAGKEGRRYLFRAPQDLPRRLQSIAGPRRTKPTSMSDELPTALL
jgi:Fic family protein